MPTDNLLSAKSSGSGAHFLCNSYASVMPVLCKESFNTAIAYRPDYSHLLNHKYNCIQFQELKVAISTKMELAISQSSSIT